MTPRTREATLRTLAFISAATLAIRVERYDDAIRLLDRADEGNVPRWAGRKLDDLRSKVQAAKGERS